MLNLKKMTKGMLGLAALASSLSAVWVMACGPDFPTQWLDDRNQTLKGTPSNSFAWEVAHLVKADDTLKANVNVLHDEENDQAIKAALKGEDESEKALLDDRLDNQKKMRALEAQGLTTAQAEQLQKMRQAENGDMAFALGEGLPEAVRLYTAAAVQYRKSYVRCVDKKVKVSTAVQRKCEVDQVAMQQRMRDRFQAVLDLPGKQRHLREVWAAYMLGKIHAAWASGENEQGDTGRSTEFVQAQKYFALVRDLAKAGAYDPEALSVASYGEEARMYLALPGVGSCDPASLDAVTLSAQSSKMSAEAYSKAYRVARSKPVECYKDVPANHYKKAIALYAQQGARGDGSASLYLLANYAFRQPELLQKLVDDSLTLRILVAYAQNYVSDTGRINRGPYPDDPEGEDRITECNEGWESCDAALGLKGVRPAPILLTLLEAVEKQKLDEVEGADRLAALAYRESRYDLAERWLGKTKTPLAYWVHAKLSLQHGDMQAAAQAYERASKAFPQVDEPSLSMPRLNRLNAEQGTLALARGEYVQAFGFYADVAQATEKQDSSYYSNPYVYDASYIAERVLTTPELKSYIDAHVPPSNKEMVGPPPNWTQPYAPVADVLRYVLARRLMRENRYDEAMLYFPSNLYFKDSQVGEHARQYSQALNKAQHAWTHVGKAQALMEAAQVARRYGMDIMGYEQFPDYRFSDGNYSCCAGHTEQEIVGMPNNYISQGERERFMAAQVGPMMHFHYRHIATDLVSAAADELPPRSQAFAASLCQAFVWMRDLDPPKAEAYYSRYVQQGARVNWNFAQPCPQPDFSGASRRQHLDSWNQTVHQIKQVMPLRIRYIALLIGLCGIGASGWVWRLWSRRRSVRCT